MADESQALSNVDVRGTLSPDNKSFYSSLKQNTPLEKAKLFNAISNPGHQTSDMIGETILVKDVIIEIIDITDDLTGEVKQAPRVVLVDVGGQTYQSVSVGIYNSIARLIQIMGEPTWEGGLPLKVRQIQKDATRRVITLEIDTSVME
jgi:hypothetical protein